MVLDSIEENENFDFQDSPYGYLICTFCRGYYELQEGESPDDFEKCECGHALEYRSTLNFHSITNKPYFEGPDTNRGDSPTPNSNRSTDGKRDYDDGKLPNHQHIINQLSQQDNITEDVLSNIQEDKRDLWNIIEEYENDARQNNKNSSQTDVIEINRLMMLVDEKRALEESGSSSKFKSIYGKIEVIHLIAAIVVLLVIVLLIVLISNFFNLI